MIDNPLIHLLQHNHSRVSNKVAFHYVNNDQYTTLTYTQLDDIVQRLTVYYKERCDIKAYTTKKGNYKRYVGIYANSDIRYITTVLALMNAQYIPICISTRNSLPAIQNLLVCIHSYSTLYT